ncbi:hypothetical protein SAMN05216553_103409 [Lentzea fradiae]|uniref:Allene oxide cyclase barrel-like domain-containing protein n=1 Tax=Lentzea fradiae TaxID=200378 RepID=A0A1G7P5L8_9PSEU|nr:hypothetical protein [Lentzea fradiae]SDF81417.1 hypothetical protein SAMN05216553_103409 [Lentzea fradiae]
MPVQPWFAVAALVAALVGADQVVADQERDRTVEVTGKQTLISAPANIAVGQGFVSGGELFDRQSGARVGEGLSHCGVVRVAAAVPPAVTALCTSVFRLPDGELHLSGSRTYESTATGFGDAVWAITGGTGAYSSAEGEVKVVRTSPTTAQEIVHEFVFTISD